METKTKITRVPLGYTERKTSDNKYVQVPPQKVWKEVHGQLILVTVLSPGVARGFRPGEMSTTRATVQAVAQKNTGKRF